MSRSKHRAERRLVVAGFKRSSDRLKAVTTSHLVARLFERSRALQGGGTGIVPLRRRRAGEAAVPPASTGALWLSTARRGAALIETALVLTLFLALVLGMLDLGIGIFRYHQLAQTARHGARQAIVHGALAPPELSAWGPATYTGAANSGDEIAQAIANVDGGSLLIGMDLSETMITVEWLDGSNELEQRVRVTLTTPYDPLFASFLGLSPHTLSASSTMQIAH